MQRTIPQPDDHTAYSTEQIALYPHISDAVSYLQQRIQRVKLQKHEKSGRATVCSGYNVFGLGLRELTQLNQAAEEQICKRTNRTLLYCDCRPCIWKMSENASKAEDE